MNTNLAVSLAILALTFQVHAQRCVEVPAGLVSQYRFEEGAPDQPATGAGSILDFVDGSRDGTPGGGPVYRADVGFDHVGACQYESNTRSLELGEGQWVSINSPFIFHDQYGDATLEFLVKPVQQGHVSLFWTRPDNNDQNRFNIAINSDGGFGFDYRDPAGVLHLTPSHIALFQIPVETWTHIAVVRDTQSSAPAHTYDFYVNGVYTTTDFDPDPNLPTSNQAWKISGREFFSFTGSVDEVRFSARKLAPSEFLINAMPPTLLTGHVAGDGSFVLTVTNAPASATNHIQVRTNLSLGNWQTIASLVPNTNSFTFADTNVSHSAQRFYRWAGIP